MILCDYCDTQNADDHKFCKECGNRLSATATSDAEASEFAPVNIPMLKSKIFLYTTKNMIADAVRELRHAIRRHPNTPDLHYMLAAVYQRLGRFDQAAAELERAVAEDSGHFDAFLMLGNLYGDDLRDHEKAIAMYRRAIAVRPDAPDVHNNLGNAYRFTGRLEEARDEFLKAIELNPNHARARFNLGKVFDQLEQYEQSAEQYLGAIRVDANYPKAHENLGEALARLGRLEEAADHVRAAIQLDPDYARAHATLARIYKKLGQNGFAGDAAHTAARLDPALGSPESILNSDS